MVVLHLEEAEEASRGGGGGGVLSLWQLRWKMKKIALLTMIGALCLIRLFYSKRRR
ncbi:MAG: hypothetical protein ACLSBH_22960 [Coprobacillus cateniformis]